MSNCLRWTTIYALQTESEHSSQRLDKEKEFTPSDIQAMNER
jgi:hypothetical protein